MARIDAAGNLTVKNATVQGTLSVTGAVTLSSTLTVTGATTLNSTLTVNGHIITGNTSGTTTVAAGAAACTTPTVTMSGNDTAGTITVTTGTGCAANGTLATVTFANAYGAAPRVIISADNTNATDLKYHTSNRTSTTFELSTNTIPADSTTYTYNYQVLQ